MSKWVVGLKFNFNINLLFLNKNGEHSNCFGALAGEDLELSCIIINI